MWEITVGECAETMRQMPAASVDAVVCDPPYGLRFMGKEFDTLGDGPAQQEWHRVWARSAFGVLKDGAPLMAFGGTRTFHRLTLALDEAGFAVDTVWAWCYGSGFPKSHDVSKAIDRRPGATEHAAFAAHLAARREAKGLSRAEVSELVVGTPTGSCWNWEHFCYPEARYWTALRDLLDLDESWARFIEGAEREVIGSRTVNGEKGTAGGYADGIASQRGLDVSGGREVDVTAPATSPAKAWEGWGTALKPAWEPIVVAHKPGGDPLLTGPGFYYCAKANKKERNAGLDEIPPRADVDGAAIRPKTRKCRVCGSSAKQPGPHGRYPSCGHEDWEYVDNKPSRHKGEIRNQHPTVKPVDAMRWLVRAATQPGDLVLDPFAGSGTTGVAAILEHRNFKGIEMNPEYAQIADLRCRHWESHAGGLQEALF